MSTIADRIKEICAQKGTSMYKLEKQLNLGNGTIGKWGKNGRQPTYDKAVAVANALGVSADYLLTGEQKEKPALQMENGLKEIDAIFEQLTPSRQSKLLELARLYIYSPFGLNKLCVKSIIYNLVNRRTPGQRGPGLFIFTAQWELTR